MALLLKCRSCGNIDSLIREQSTCKECGDVAHLTPENTEVDFPCKKCGNFKIEAIQKEIKMYPVIGDSNYTLRLKAGEDIPHYPKKVPWTLLEKHEKQVMENHCGQTLEGLAERGGLCPKEMIAAIKGFGLFTPEFEDMKTEEAILELRRILDLSLTTLFGSSE